MKATLTAKFKAEKAFRSTKAIPQEDNLMGKAIIIQVNMKLFNSRHLPAPAR